MSLQKFKIKEQVEEIKSQFESQKSLIPAQSQFLFTMMVQLMELLIVVFEERFTRKNSSNSSLPPSKDKGSRKKKTRKRSPVKKVQIADPPEQKKPDDRLTFILTFATSAAWSLEVISLVVMNQDKFSIL